MSRADKMSSEVVAGLRKWSSPEIKLGPSSKNESRDTLRVHMSRSWTIIHIHLRKATIFRRTRGIRHGLRLVNFRTSFSILNRTINLSVLTQTGHKHKPELREVVGRDLQGTQRAAITVAQYGIRSLKLVKPEYRSY